MTNSSPSRGSRGQSRIIPYRKIEMAETRDNPSALGRLEKRGETSENVGLTGL